MTDKLATDLEAGIASKASRRTELDFAERQARMAQAAELQAFETNAAELQAWYVLRLQFVFVRRSALSPHRLNL